MTNTKDYINFFNNSLQSSNSIQRDPSVGDSMDWKGLGLSLIDPATKAIKGADTAIKLNKAYNTFAPMSLLGKTQNSVNTASKLSVGLKGAGKALGGTVGVGNLALTTASFLPGAKEADYSTGAEKALKIGSTAVGLGSAGAAALGLGAAALGPVGLALGAGVLASNLAGKTAKKHSVSAQDTLQNVGSGYGNLNEDIKAAGKKFSLFRRKDAKKVNRNIRNIDQDRMQAADIGYTNKQNTIAGINSIGDIQSKNQQSLFGGLNTNILSAKNGDKIREIKTIATKVKKLQKGKKLSFEEWYKKVPLEKNDTTHYRLKYGYESDLIPKEELDKFINDPKAHLFSAYLNNKTGDYEFLKSKKHPTIQLELDSYYSDKNKDFRKEYKLVDDGSEYYKYVKIKKFEEGGKFNVIPDGALHARKHNLDLDNITNKGIPVVSGDILENTDGTLELQKGGEITQHAEIEKEEIIFHKELTKKIESLYEKYKSGDKEAAIEAGKILVYEILENTIDNTEKLLNEK